MLVMNDTPPLLNVNITPKSIMMIRVQEMFARFMFKESVSALQSWSESHK